MTWVDNLLPASFRGVGFMYRDTSRIGGRKFVNHEFPLRDENDLEDLGKRAKQHRIEGVVLGDDYMSDRDALEEALDAAGTATLVHPYKGNLTVGCPEYTLRESQEYGGCAIFEMTFIEGGSQPSPTSSTNTATTAYNAASGQQSTLASDFGALYQLASLPGFILDQLSSVATGLISDLTGLSGNPLLPVGAFASDLAAISAATSNPTVLGPAVTQFFSDYADAAAGVLPVDDPTLSSRGQPPVTDPSYGLAAFATWGSTLAPVLGSTPQRLQQAANQQALINLVQGSAVAAMAQLYANTTFASAADAESARDQLIDLIDAQATTAGDAGDDLAYGGWMTVYSASATDLTTRAQNLPQILTLTFGANLPALMLAQRIYQDGSQAPELVARNNAPHPLFMPLTLEVLAPAA